MAKVQKHGGVARSKGAGAKLTEIQRSALLVVPVAKTRKPKIIKARNIDDFIGQVPQNFKVSMRRADGSSARETIQVQEFDDIELGTITLKSEVLREQQFQKDFLHRFLDEWRHNPSFRQELQEIVADPERKNRLIAALRSMGKALNNAQSPLAALLAS